MEPRHRWVPRLRGSSPREGGVYWRIGSFTCELEESDWPKKFMWRGSGSVPPAPAPLQRAIPLFWPVHLAVWNLTGMSGIRFSGNQDVRGHCYLRGGSEGDTCHSHRVSLHQSPNYHQGNVIRASWIPGLHWSRTAHTAVQSTFGAGPRLACSGTHSHTTTTPGRQDLYWLPWKNTSNCWHRALSNVDAREHTPASACFVEITFNLLW